LLLACGCNLDIDALKALEWEIGYQYPVIKVSLILSNAKDDTIEVFKAKANQLWADTSSTVFQTARSRPGALARFELASN
jgi:hypothetical protein